MSTHRLGSRTRPRAPRVLFALVFAAACGGDDGAPPLADDDGDTEPATSSTSSTPTVTTDDSVDSSSSGFVPLCTPGEQRCNADNDAIEICAPTGLEYELQLQCGTYSSCQPCEDDVCLEPTCVGPCELSENDPSSAGCAFVANRQLHPYEEFADGLVVTNPNEELMAAIQVFAVPDGVLEESMLESFNLEPGQSRTLELSTDFVPGTSSNLRTGGIFRVYSDVPVIAYQHAPLRANRGNESSLLLPDQVLGMDYVVVSYASLVASGVRGASYFELVALEDETVVTWTPPVDTAGNGLPIEPVAAGDTGQLILNRYETLRIVPSREGLSKGNYNNEFELLDISGTRISSDKPVWVTGANKLSRVPLGDDGGTGDQLQETLFPLQHWGREYVLPSAIARPWEELPDNVPEDYAESNYYRVYAGTQTVTITSTPEDPAFPIMLDEVGDYVDVVTAPGTNLTLTADGAFLPVQYLRSRNAGPTVDEPDTGYGDSAMVQMVPTEQYLSRYVFATGVDFFYNFVQITRAASDAEVRIIAESGGGITTVCNDGCDYAFSPAGDFEVAQVPILEGTYTADSDEPFGIIQSGHARGVGLDPKTQEALDTTCANLPDSGFCNATYAYPGGMRTETIFIP